MNRLAFSKKFIFTLFAVLFSVNLWGQETPSSYSLNSCKIVGVNDYYNYTRSDINVEFSVLWDYNDGESEDWELTEGTDYTYKFKDENGEEVSVNGKGFYRLVVTGTGNYGGTITKDFYVLNINDYTLTGSGTETTPYLINNEDDWMALATHPDYWASGKYIKLNADVTVGSRDGDNITKSGLMVGTSGNPFKGHFIGYDDENDKYYTLTFYYTGHGIEGVPVAPFQYTNGAQFKDLNVAGEIKKYVYGSAGLIGHNVNTTKVDDVVVDLFINCGTWDGSSTVWSHRCGGFAVDGSGVEFTNCVYRGKLLTVIDDRNGGFCGKGSAKTKFKNCLFCPEECSLNGVIFANGGTDYLSDSYGVVHPGQDKAIGSVDEDCYYTEDRNGQSGFKQGTFAYKSVGEGGLNGEIGHKLTKTYLGVEYDLYQPVTVDIDNDIYLETGDDIIPDFTLYFDDIEANTEYYSTSITGGPLHNAGNYPMTITGVHEEDDGPGYYGSTTKILKVIPADATWTALQTLIDNYDVTPITLTKDYYARSEDNAPIIIDDNKTIVINLNGHTINRNLVKATEQGQVLKIKKGTVTINGPGIITGGYNKESSGNIDGGGIYNMGTLTLNNVTVSGNQCVKKNQNSTDPTARGGGIYSGQNSYLYINGCLIKDNRAQGGAGGLFVYKTKECTIGDYSDSKSTIHTSISSNNSLDKGGGIRVNGNTTLTNCIIRTNEVNNGTNLSVANGGGIHLDEGNLTLNNCTINNNTASKYGGGIYAIKGTITAKNCEINYNQSYDSNMNFEGRGGGVYMHSGTFKMEGGSIRSNASNLANGGGMYLNGAIFEIKSSDDKVIKINDNWTFDEDSKIKTTNVYLVGASKIKITDDITGSNIGVATNNGPYVFTTGLSGNGTIALFTSDDGEYDVALHDDEAKLVILNPWTPPTKPEEDGYYHINNAVAISNTVTVGGNGIKFGDNGSLTILPGGYLTADIINTDPTKLIIKGGELVTTSENVAATMKKDISSALALNGRFWYLISSGIATPTITSNTNLIKMSANDYPEYDLYRFNESVTNNLQWENYRNAEHDDFTTLENGRGYLYRNANDYTISISGTLNSTDEIETNLTCTQPAEGTNVLKGFNIIGNPYPHNIKKGTNAGEVEYAINNGELLENNYYVLLEDSTWEPVDDGEEIHVMEGILVQAKKGGTLTISKIPAPAPASKGENDIKTSNNKIWFTINNNEYKDRACVEFKSGHGLNKIAHLNEEAPMLYVNYNGENFASVDMNPEAKAFDLSFEAKTTGVYTLKADPQGEYGYLHLIDKLAGRDIDLLVDNEYTFIGSKTDQADRFIVRLENTENAENSTFAYQSGNDIVVSGTGELQVFDVMGRFVMSRNVNGYECIGTSMLKTGVYILRIVGDQVKTQKIVVR